MKSITQKLLIICVAFALYACSTATEKNNEVKDSVITDTAHKHSEHKHAHTQANQPKKKKPLSPRKMVMADVGENHVHVDYGAPSVRERVIWGGLVAYDKVWASGAHSATSITFSKDVVVNGQQIKAGKYAFFTIPGKDMWTLIINKNHAQHLADDYSEKDDIVRIKVKPVVLPSPQEQLKYEVVATAKNEAMISLSWDKIKVSFTVKNA